MTPRPAMPLITVSLSPHNLSEYQDLFYVSPSTPSSSPPPNPCIAKSDVPIYPRRGQTPASTIAAAHRQANNTGDARSPSMASGKNSDSDKETLLQESPRLVTPDGEKGLPVSLHQHPPAATRLLQSPENGNLAMRSRVKTLASRPKCRPPSMPLPQPPVTNTHPWEIYLSPLKNTFEAELKPTTLRKVTTRPQANKMTSLGNSSLPITLSRPTIKLTATLSLPFADIFDFDIETASVEQLRKALTTQNQQYDELTTYMVRVTEKYVSELGIAQKRVCALDKKVVRKDKELKGLRWIIDNKDSVHPQ